MALAFLDSLWTDLLQVERLRDDGHANGDDARCRVVEVVEVTDGALSQRPKIFSHESAFWFKMAEFSAKYGVLAEYLCSRPKVDNPFRWLTGLDSFHLGRGPGGPPSWDENCLRKVCPDHAGQSAEDGEEGRQSEDKQDGNVETTAPPAPRPPSPVQSSPTDSFRFRKSARAPRRGLEISLQKMRRRYARNISRRDAEERLRECLSRYSHVCVDT